MKRWLTLVTLITLVSMLLIMVVPASAHQAPGGANINSLDISISGYGDVSIDGFVQYEVTVSVPFYPGSPINPCFQSNVRTYFTNPHDVRGVPDPDDPNGIPPTHPQTITILFPGINGILPGESWTYAKDYTEHVAYVGPIPRADLIKPGAEQMPANAQFETVRSPIGYAGLGYTITEEDLILNPALLAFARASGTAHLNEGIEDVSVDEATIGIKDLPPPPPPTPNPPNVPASSGAGIGILIAGFAGVMIFIRKRKRTT
jgi:hypothetical protein